MKIPDFFFVLAEEDPDLLLFLIFLVIEERTHSDVNRYVRHAQFKSVKLIISKKESRKWPNRHILCFLKGRGELKKPTWQSYSAATFSHYKRIKATSFILILLCKYNPV
jgi:hypothetical protein